MYFSVILLVTICYFISVDASLSSVSFQDSSSITNDKRSLSVKEISLRRVANLSISYSQSPPPSTTVSNYTNITTLSTSSSAREQNSTTPSSPSEAKLMNTSISAHTEPTFGEDFHDVEELSKSSVVTFEPSQEPSLTPSFTMSLEPSLQPTSTSFPSFSQSSLSSIKLSTKPPEELSITSSTSLSLMFLIATSIEPSLSPSMHDSIVPSESTTTFEPSSFPSFFLTTKPSCQPSSPPSNLPSHLPSNMPSTKPSYKSSMKPSVIPTIIPSTFPTAQPSESPSIILSVNPSLVPSENPSDQPSKIPTNSPSTRPSVFPSDFPSFLPSFVPSTLPSIFPSLSPTLSPSSTPSINPSAYPSVRPSDIPSSPPSMIPSSLPTLKCHDMNSYQNPITGHGCEAHTGTQCEKWSVFGMSEDEVKDLIENCPVSCKVECGAFSARPSLYPSSTPSHSPTSDWKSFSIPVEFDMNSVRKLMEPSDVKVFERISLQYFKDTFDSETSHYPETKFLKVMLSSQEERDTDMSSRRYLRSATSTIRSRALQSEKRDAEEEISLRLSVIFSGSTKMRNISDLPNILTSLTVRKEYAESLRQYVFFSKVTISASSFFEITESEEDLVKEKSSSSSVAVILLGTVASLAFIASVVGSMIFSRQRNKDASGAFLGGPTSPKGGVLGNPGGNVADFIRRSVQSFEEGMRSPRSYLSPNNVRSNASNSTDSITNDGNGINAGRSKKNNSNASQQETGEIPPMIVIGNIEGEELDDTNNKEKISLSKTEMNEIHTQNSESENKSTQLFVQHMEASSALSKFLALKRNGDPKGSKGNISDFFSTLDVSTRNIRSVEDHDESSQSTLLSHQSATISNSKTLNMIESSDNDHDLTVSTSPPVSEIAATSLTDEISRQNDTPLSGSDSSPTSPSFSEALLFWESSIKDETVKEELKNDLVPSSKIDIAKSSKEDGENVVKGKLELPIDKISSSVSKEDHLSTIGLDPAVLDVPEENEYRLKDTLETSNLVSKDNDKSCEQREKDNFSTDIVNGANNNEQNEKVPLSLPTKHKTKTISSIIGRKHPFRIYHNQEIPPNTSGDLSVISGLTSSASSMRVDVLAMPSDLQTTNSSHSRNSSGHDSIGSNNNHNKSHSRDWSDEVEFPPSRGHRYTFNAPSSGKLGIIIESSKHHTGPTIHTVKDYSPLFGKLQKGDKLIKVDGESTLNSTTPEVTRLLARKRSEKSGVGSITVTVISSHEKVGCTCDNIPKPLNSTVNDNTTNTNDNNLISHLRSHLRSNLRSDDKGEPEDRDTSQRPMPKRDSIHSGINGNISGSFDQQDSHSTKSIYYVSSVNTPISSSCVSSPTLNLMVLSHSSTEEDDLSSTCSCRKNEEDLSMYCSDYSSDVEGGEKPFHLIGAGYSDDDDIFSDEE